MTEQIRKTTSSDVELEMFQLSEQGKIAYANEESFKEGDFEDISNSYMRIKIRQNKGGKVFTCIAHKGKITNGSITTKVIDEIEVSILVIAIPANTFQQDGYIWASVTTKEDNEHFEDGTKDTESEFKKLEVYYVSQ